MAVYSLVTQPRATQGQAIRVDVVFVELVTGQTLAPQHIFVNAQDDKEVKLSATRSWIAYEELKAKEILSPHSLIAKSGVTFDFAGNRANQVKESSAGLCFLIKMAQELLEESLRSKGKPVPSYDFAATGILVSMNTDEAIDRVEAIEEKITAALAVLEKGGTVFYPQANNPLTPALSQAAEQKQIALVAVNTPRQALDFVLEKYRDGSDGGPQPKPKWLKRILLTCLVVALGMILGSPFVPSPISITATLHYEGEGGKALLLAQGKALTKGDGFRIRLDVDEDCFVYVLQADSEDHIAWLFPSETDSQPLSQGQHWVPEDKDEREQWIELDDVKGKETVLVWATTSRSSWLENRRGRMNSSGDLNRSARRGLRKEIEEYLEHEQKDQRGILERLTFAHE